MSQITEGAPSDELKEDANNDNEETTVKANHGPHNGRLTILDNRTHNTNGALSSSDDDKESIVGSVNCNSGMSFYSPRPIESPKVATPVSQTSYHNRIIRSIRTSFHTLWRLPKSIILRIDGMARDLFHQTGVHSKRVIKQISMMIRLTILFYYYLIIWCIPAVSIVLGIILFLTWVAVIAFYCFYSYYVPVSSAISIPVRLIRQSYRPVEVWMLPDHCKVDGTGPLDTIRYMPSSLGFMTDIANHTFMTQEAECGLSEASLTSDMRPTSLIGGIPFPACHEKCDTSGMLPWSTSMTKEAELYHTYLTNDALWAQFRGQPVDVGMEIILDSESIGSLPGLHLDWTVTISHESNSMDDDGTAITNGTMKRKMTSYMYKPSILSRFFRVMSDTVTPPFISKHEVYKMFSTRLLEYIFFDVPSSPSSDLKTPDMSKIEYIAVNLTPAMRVNTIELLIRPRLQGNVWYLANYTMPLFIVFWLSFLTMTIVPLFFICMIVYVFLMSYILRIVKNCLAKLFPLRSGSALGGPPQYTPVHSVQSTPSTQRTPLLQKQSPFSTVKREGRSHSTPFNSQQSVESVFTYRPASRRHHSVSENKNKMTSTKKQTDSGTR